MYPSIMLHSIRQKINTLSIKVGITKKVKYVPNYLDCPGVIALNNNQMSVFVEHYEMTVNLTLD